MGKPAGCGVAENSPVAASLRRSLTQVQYKVAGILLGIGVVPWVVTVLVNRATSQVAAAPLTGEADMRGPVNESGGL